MSQVLQAYNNLDAKEPYYDGKPRNLEVKFTSWSKRHLRITDDSISGPLVYTADIHTRKPNIVFQSTSTSQVPATVTFHTWSSAVDMSIDGDTTTSRTTRLLKNDREFESRGLGGRTLKWRRRSILSFTNDFECVDARSGKVLATFYSHRGISMTRAGRFEISGPEVLRSKRVTDEIIVSGLAHVYLEYVARSSAAGASAGAAGAGAGAGGGGC